MLRINEKNYNFINKVYNFISVERLHNLKKYGNTIVGPKKVAYIKKRLEDVGVDEIFDTTSGFDYIWSETTEQEILDEIACIISHVSGIEVKVIKTIYPSDILVPGESDYTYLVVDARRNDLIESAKNENELIRIANEKRLSIPKNNCKSNITHYF